MQSKISKLLSGNGENYIFPFFWQHGEEETKLREYMKIISEAGIGAVCVESRPHPDFCGEKWWTDMDIILEEARNRDMKVWILDDSHFPTGFANGAVLKKSADLCRQSIAVRTYHAGEGEVVSITGDELMHPKPFESTQIEQMILDQHHQREFTDDQIYGLIGMEKASGKVLDLTSLIQGDEFTWEAPEGDWTLYLMHLSRNLGYHRSYINMMDHDSCRILIDEVYESHFTHYKDDFGRAIAGFFSDEPELGNGHLYNGHGGMGEEIDYPWSSEILLELEKNLTKEEMLYLPLIWENDADEQCKARIRYAYMDAVTKLVRKDFSMQLGDWCREHNVKYIGHLIEDNGHHSKTEASLGHFFRGLAGQDMAGIDDIGGQVMPQMEDVSFDRGIFQKRDGEFYHYVLGKLGSSAAAIEPGKHVDSMCEIFGAYGWSEGVRLEKYLVDHFLVRGINHYVPHAFSPKEFPDPDCPPHFYANGHNPQYRHFGALMRYLNRVCELISDGKPQVDTALLYDGEADWCGEAMQMQMPAHKLYDDQIDYHIIPQDVFSERILYQTQIEEGRLCINSIVYKTVVVPYMQFITEEFATALKEMTDHGIPVFFCDALPQGLCNGTKSQLDSDLKKCRVVPLADLAKALRSDGYCQLQIEPADNRIRLYTYLHNDGSKLLMVVNEGTKNYKGTILCKEEYPCYRYDAWNQELQSVPYDGSNLLVSVEPLHSQLFLFTNEDLSEQLATQKEAVISSMQLQGTVTLQSDEWEEIPFDQGWNRSICESIEYPMFHGRKQVSLPDRLSEEEPLFSGFVRYENSFASEMTNTMVLEITDAFEGVEVFVNGETQGIQIVPPFRYVLSKGISKGQNQIAIEVATTLERKMSKTPSMFGMPQEPECGSGITGEVRLYKKE